MGMFQMLFFLKNKKTKNGTLIKCMSCVYGRVLSIEGGGSGNITLLLFEHLNSVVHRDIHDIWKTQDN